MDLAELMLDEQVTYKEVNNSKIWGQDRRNNSDGLEAMRTVWMLNGAK